MRIFSVESDRGFTEYERLPFEVEHQESVLEGWLESNPDGILEDGRLLIIGRQIRTDLGGFVDLLGVDREGSAVVVELKRDRTPRDVVAQAIEYAAFASRLDVHELEGILRVHQHDESLSLAARHREYFGIDEAVAVAFNKDQRIVIIGQRVTPEIRQTASFLGSKGIRVTCVEFTFFQAVQALRDRAGISRKTGASGEVIDRLRNSAEATGLFTSAGRDLKCAVDREFTDDEMTALVAWCESVQSAIVEHGLRVALEQ